VPSFTRNWLTKQRPDVAPPPAEGRFDVAAMIVTGLALLVWVVRPDSAAASWAVLAAGIAVMLRLARWRGVATGREPLLAILHVGYGWLGLGLVLLGLGGLLDMMPPPAALHALTVGAIGTMTLAVMTRASLGHTGRRLAAGPGTKAIYALVTVAAVLRVLSPFAGAWTEGLLWLAGIAWSGAFGLFAVLYGRVLTSPRVRDETVAPI
jgi:uncharacterized protein involved in response to NO